MKENILPLPYPEFPSPVADLKKREENLLLWEQQMESVREENNRRFEKALKPIRRCAFWRGFTQWAKPDISQHYSWCPYDEWMGSMNKREHVSF